jgi:hypothetical protein
MAAALFGGIVPGSSATITTSTATSIRAQRIKPEKPVPAVAAVASAPVTVGPEVDLLDFTFGETTAVASSSQQIVDILAPTPVATEAPVSTLPPQKPVELPDDPFAASGLLSSLSDTPLSPPLSYVKFE